MPDNPEPASKSESPSSLLSPAWATIIVGSLSVASAIAVAAYNASAQREVVREQAAAQRELEREQFESNLILKAISSGDKKQSYDNLRFLVEAQLIRRSSDKVSRLLQDTSFHFHLPSERPAAPSLALTRPVVAFPIRDVAPTFSGLVLDAATSQPLRGVAVAIKTRRSRMRDVERQNTGADGQFKLHYPSRYYYLTYRLLGYVEQTTWHHPGVRFKNPLVVKMKRVGSQR